MNRYDFISGKLNVDIGPLFAPRRFITKIGARLENRNLSLATIDRMRDSIMMKAKYVGANDLGDLIVEQDGSATVFMVDAYYDPMKSC